MNHQEKRQWLINYLLLENKQSIPSLPNNAEDQKNLLRALMNIREAKPISHRFLSIQDQYLQEELQCSEIFTLSDTVEYTAQLSLWQGDMTKLSVDGIVNAANSQLLGCFSPLHQCIDNAIHSAAGIQLRLACLEIMQKQQHLEETGLSKITSGYNLPSKFVFHTVGPIIRGNVTVKEKQLLASCYRNVLESAVKNKLNSVAFCCISTGEFHFPNDLAVSIAVDTVTDFLKTNKTNLKVVFNVFKDLDKELYHARLQKISASV